MIRLLRFFGVSRLHPRHSAILLTACVGFGVWTMSHDPRELDGSLGLLLVIQLFLVSTGFTSRAFAGHFDSLMVAGQRRRAAALAHWVVSITPGVIGWLVVAAAGFLLGSPAALSALVGQRAVALLIVSSLAWVAGYRLPRGSAGVLWLAILVAILLQHNLRALSMSLDQGQHGWLWESVVVVVCPFLLIGDKPIVPAVPLAAASVFSVVSLVLVAAATDRLDVILRERG